VNEVVVFGETT